MSKNYYVVRLKNAFVYQMRLGNTPLLYASKLEAENWRRGYNEPKDWVVVKVKLTEVEK